MHHAAVRQKPLTKSYVHILYLTEKLNFTTYFFKTLNYGVQLNIIGPYFNFYIHKVMHAFTKPCELYLIQS